MEDFFRRLFFVPTFALVNRVERWGVIEANGRRKVAPHDGIAGTLKPVEWHLSLYSPVVLNFKTKHLEL